MSGESLQPQPESLQRSGDASIKISWSDGTTTIWTATQLRRACPCATCREKKRSAESVDATEVRSIGLPVLSAAEARPLQIEAMRPVGNYAYNIAFSDGHASGIFQLSKLHQGPPAN